MNISKEEFDKALEKVIPHIARIFNKPPRNPERIERILEKLRLIWVKHPDIRFNQLIIAINKSGAIVKDDYFNLEDEEFEKLIDQWMNDYS